MNLKECSWILNFFTNSENSVILLFEWHEQFIHYYIVSDMSCSKCYEYLVCALDWQMFTLEAIEFSYENISSWILDRVYAFIHLLDDVLDCFAERSELILLNSPSLRDRSERAGWPNRLQVTTVLMAEATTTCTAAPCHGTIAFNYGSILKNEVSSPFLEASNTCASELGAIYGTSNTWAWEQ